MANGGRFVDQWSELVLDDRTLKSHEKLVLLAHARYADWNTGANCRPGCVLIARDTSMTTQAVARIRRRLEARGYLRLVGERGSSVKGGARIASEYQLGRPYLTGVPETPVGDEIEDDRKESA